ncbi:glycoside hydrolase family 88/105 protein [Lachnotalea sp. AF33-28]|uniref:glycoside hydrolase family 88/105 protein n=1 Tax=Lachnotalea sp. AF33-28 TaxID=2292046 RepID=UPI000E48D8D6|nr:glycoside hydrolase family 88 protein [Lachnotalea sp. AF33-28]RHP29078.1 hypothetical protein DWZ56_22245 [Lachnotalea sp. AF33-28]
MYNNLSQRLADTIIKRYPEADLYPYRSWSYPQGYLLIGMIKLWNATGNIRYRDYIYTFCKAHVSADGSILGFTGCSMDDMMAGAVLAWMYEQTGEERYAAACRRIYNAFQDYPRTREGGFLHNRTEYPGEMWVDGVFMGQMFYCRYGRVFHEPACFDETKRQLELIYYYCHTHGGMLVHAYSEDSRAVWAGKDGRSECVWSEGLGWYALILTEVLGNVPQERGAWQTACRQLKALLAGLLAMQDEKTGLWYQIVDRPDHPDNWCDTSGSAMFTYAFAYALQHGLVIDAAYKKCAGRGYEALLKRAVMNENGLIDVYGACEGLCVQKCFDDYIRYPQKVNAQEAVCGCLWAAVASEFHV